MAFSRKIGLAEPGPKLDATGAPLTPGGKKILSAQEDMDLIDPKAAGEQSRDTLTLLMMDQQPDVIIDRMVTPAPEMPFQIVSGVSESA